MKKEEIVAFHERIARRIARDGLRSRPVTDSEKLRFELAEKKSRGKTTDND